MSPVKYMRGNISGRQGLEYDGSDAYSIPTGETTPADVYQPRIVAKVLREPFIDRLNYFQVRTRSTVNMTENMKRNLALMGGTGAIFASIVSDKQSQLYIECVQVCPSGETLRGWMTPMIRQGLAAKDATISISEQISINNPWVTGGTGVTVNIPQAILEKFNSVLSNS